MKRTLSILAVFWAGLAGIHAERIYLKNGENIQGKITEVNEDILTVESDLGYGIVRISKKDIVTINFPHADLNLTRRYAIGYVNRAQNSIGSASDYNYRTDQFSLRTYLVKDIFLQYLLGYGQIDVKDQSGQQQQVSSFTSNIRVANVLYRQMNSLVYGGLGVGIVSIRDTTQGYDEQGTDISIMFGGEIFIGALPNFGISAEIELSKFATSSIQRSDLNISAFPTFSVHYYF